MRRIWLDDALTNIQTIHNFYSPLNPSFANKIVKEIFEETAILENYPQIAPVELYIEEKKIEFRSLILVKGRIKVIYYIKNNNIMIATILDCRQNISSILNKLKIH